MAFEDLGRKKLFNKENKIFILVLRHFLYSRHKWLTDISIKKILIEGNYSKSLILFGTVMN